METRRSLHRWRWVAPASDKTFTVTNPPASRPWRSCPRAPGPTWTRPSPPPAGVRPRALAAHVGQRRRAGSSGPLAGHPGPHGRVLRDHHPGRTAPRHLLDDGPVLARHHGARRLRQRHRGRSRSSRRQGHDGPGPREQGAGRRGRRIIPWNVPLFIASMKLGGAGLRLDHGAEARSGDPFDSYLLAEVPRGRSTCPRGVVNIVAAGRDAGEASCPPGHRQGELHRQHRRRPQESAPSAASSSSAAPSSWAASRPRSSSTTPTSTPPSPKLMPAAMMNNGRACVAQTRVLAPPQLRYEEVVDALAAAVGARRSATSRPRGRDPGRSWLSASDRVGATSRAGHREVPASSSVAVARRHRQGLVRQATVFADVTNEMTIARSLRPVVSVIAYEDEADAVRIANESGVRPVRLGLDRRPQAQHQRGQGPHRHLRREHRRGHRPSSPFGGFKASGVGLSSARGHRGVHRGPDHRPRRLTPARRQRPVTTAMSDPASPCRGPRAQGWFRENDGEAVGHPRLRQGVAPPIVANLDRAVYKVSGGRWVLTSSKDVPILMLITVGAKTGSGGGPPPPGPRTATCSTSWAATSAARSTPPGRGTSSRRRRRRSPTRRGPVTALLGPDERRQRCGRSCSPSGRTTTATRAQRSRHPGVPPRGAPTAARSRRPGGLGGRQHVSHVPVAGAGSSRRCSSCPPMADRPARRSRCLVVVHLTDTDVQARRSAAG